MKLDMNKNLILSLVAFMAMSIAFQSCKKDDDMDTPAVMTIKKLTQTPINVLPSTYKLDGGSAVEADEAESEYEVEGFNGNFIRIVKDGKTIFLLGQGDAGLDGNAFYYDENNVLFAGIDLTIDNSGLSDNQGFITIMGTVMNTNTETHEIFVSVSAGQLGAGTSSYEVMDTKALLKGGGQGLGTVTYNQILEINSQHPNVTTIVLTNISGSVNDDINVQTGRLIREAGYTTHLPSNGDISSGGVDLFTAGLKRTKEAGGKIGVHSWCCYEGETADNLPMDSPGHAKQLSYFKEMLGETNGADFYFFTLQAAPHDGIHQMTDAEIEKYKLLTE